LQDELPAPVRDYIGKYLRGEKLPYSDIESDAERYGDTELLVAILADHIVTNEPLPGAATDYVQEYLYRLEESSSIHIWNTPDVLRVAYPIMLAVTGGEGGYLMSGDTTDANAVKTALRRLCTRRELLEFYERHGIADNYKGRDQLAESVPVDLEHTKTAAMTLARVLADPATSFETREELGHALREFSMSSGVTVEHPALAARAYELMCEAKPKGVMRREAKRDRKRLLDLLDTITEKAKASDAE
jgi:hypothetical protein